MSDCELPLELLATSEAAPKSLDDISEPLKADDAVKPIVDAKPVEPESASENPAPLGKPVKLKKHVDKDKHANAALAAADNRSSALDLPGSTCKKIKTEVKDDPRKTPVVASPSNFLAALGNSQTASAANALSAYSASYLQSLQSLGFSPYQTMFGDPAQNNPFLPSAGSFGFTQNTDLKTQEALLKSLSVAVNSSSSSNGVHNSALSCGNTASTPSVKATCGSSGSAKHDKAASAQNGRAQDGFGKEKEPQASSVAQILGVRSLSHGEASSLKQLILGYREAAALLVKSADELEGVLEGAGCKL